MRHEVVLAADAESDLEHICRYIAGHDSPASANHVLEELLAASQSLADHPERGSIRQELRSLGIAECRQVFFKPYRLIYRTHGDRVVIYVIADERRDMQSLLARRTLGA